LRRVKDILILTRQIGEVESMKKVSSVFRMALSAITAPAVCLRVLCGVASAQTSSPATNAAAAPAVTATPPRPPDLPYGAGEVVKMYQGGIDKDVIVNYINNTVLPYHLAADDIIYLQTLGLPHDITKAMIQRDGQLQQQAMAMRQQYYQQQPAAAQEPPVQNGVPPAQPPPEVAAPATVAPATTIIGTDYYDAGYPYYYDWPYYYGYGGPVVIGGYGWGWGGRGWGGFRGGYGGFRGGGGGGFRGGGGGGGGSHGGGGGGGGHR
jgi:hypothetical protein